MASRSPRLSPESSFFSALRSQRRIIGALILRELHARFGRHNIGYLWMIAEPLMLATVISTLHYVGHVEGGSGMGPFPFTVIGYCTFIIFRNTFNRAPAMIQGAAPLMHHRMITPFDVVLANAVVEMCGCFSSLVLLMTVAVILGIAEPPVRPLYLLFAVFQMSWLTLSMSLIVASYAYDNHLLERFVHPFSYFMIPLSGAFFTMSFLPIWARDYMAWNPMMSIFETARYGQFKSGTDDHIHTGYTIAVCAAFTYWGLLAIRRLRTRIHVS